MANPFDRIGEFSEQGRGVPVTASRPAPALPFSPLARQAYAPTPRVRIGWATGVVTVGEVTLDPPRAVALGGSLADVARLLVYEESDFVPVAEEGILRGAVYVEDVLKLVAENQLSLPIAKVLSPQIPTCTLGSALVDAVRQMIACYLRRIPVVGDDGTLLGMLTMSAADAAAEKDPSVRDLFDECTGPAFFARRWR